jgi:hypothetical protein
MLLIRMANLLSLVLIVLLEIRLDGGVPNQSRIPTQIPNMHGIWMMEHRQAMPTVATGVFIPRLFGLDILMLLTAWLSLLCGHHQRPSVTSAKYHFAA